MISQNRSIARFTAVAVVAGAFGLLAAAAPRATAQKLDDQGLHQGGT